MAKITSGKLKKHYIYTLKELERFKQAEIEKTKNSDRDKDACQQRFPIFGQNGYHQHSAHDNSHGCSGSGDSHSVEPSHCNAQKVDAFPF